MRIALVGASGLVGRQLVAATVGRGDVSVLALARRKVAVPLYAPVEPVVADPAKWGAALAGFKPDVLVGALGTTWRKAGRDEAAFRAVDHDLVLETGRAAREHGASRMVVVSSVGADLSSKSFYLRVKAEMERDVTALHFERLDILRPGLLRGERTADRRIGERAAIALSPLSDALLRGGLAKYRSVAAEEVARAALTLACETAPGTFVHHNEDIVRAARTGSRPS